MLLLAVGLALGPALQTGYEQLEPDWGAKAKVVYATESEGGLRYTWWLPKREKDSTAPRTMTVIMHGTGLDYRWGAANHSPEDFRTRDVVVSVDGPSAGSGESRLFLDQTDDVEAVRAFLEEVRSAFEIDQLFLYGHSQGGFFVIHYACAHPDTVDGVVAHASGAWLQSRASKKVHGVPIAFLHGTQDPVVGYRNSTASFEAYQEKGFPMLHLRRMEGYNHWPNGLRSTEALDWCEGMVTPDPQRALLLAGELARPKRTDGYGYDQPPDWSGARMVLRRLQGEGPLAFRELEPKLAKAAEKLVKEIEKIAAAQVKLLRKAVGKKLELDDRTWPARFLAVRADLRGTDALEEWLDSIGWEKFERKQQRAADSMLKSWWSQSAEDSEKLESILDALPDCFLYDSFPQGFEAAVRELLKHSDDFDLPKKTRKRLGTVEAWLDGLEEGRKEYRKDWPRP